MSVKRSPAARVIEFFTQAPVGEADLVFGLVRDIVRKRQASEAVSGVPKVIVHKRRQRVKVNAKANDATLAGQGPQPTSVA
jgi:hypothetical protein